MVIERASPPLSGETEPANGLASPLGAVGGFSKSPRLLERASMTTLRSSCRVSISSAL